MNELTEYAFSTDEEWYQDTCEAATIEDASVIAEGELSLEAGERFFVGEVRRPTLSELAASVAGNVACDVIERLSDAAYDIGGDAAECWPEFGEQSTSDLETALKTAICGVLEKHFGTPSFFYVNNIREFVAGEDHGDAEDAE